jgi:mRNA-degrading endonuclease RelE of RelBE toxin-antitoxin system
VKYDIISSPEAQEEIGTLRASDRAKVLDAIEIHLRYEPEKLSKSRIKRLKAIAQPQYRLRVDDLRVFVRCDLHCRYWDSRNSCG